MSRRFRSAARAGAIAAAIVLAGSLAGCSTISTLVSHLRSETQKPTAGQCWSSNYEEAQTAADWNTGPVSCSQSHQLYTFAVVSVTSSASSWHNSAGDLDDSIATDAYQACDKKLAVFLPTVVPGGRLSEFFFVPSDRAWKQGARWVRCDIGVLKAGSSFASPAFAALPSSISVLLRQAQSEPDLFADCVNTTDPSGKSGPYDDPKATIADCTGDYQWKYESEFPILDDDTGDAAYPSDEVFNAQSQKKCGDAADAAERGWIAYTPTEKQWTNGNHSGECWFGQAAATPQT